MIRSCEDLEIYQAAKQIALTVHKLTRRFPKHEIYELGSQMRRAAVSVGANIAEGYGRKAHLNDFKRFLEIANGSNNELKFMLDICIELGYLSCEEYADLKMQLDKQGKRIYATISKWR